MAKKQPLPKTGLSMAVSEWLWVKLKEWAALGIISPEQKAEIQDLYLWPKHLTHPTPPSKPVNLILILEIIGALLVGAGLITFVAFNWPVLPKAAKLLLILGLIALIQAGAFFLAFRTKYPQAGQALALLGNLVYGAGIWLVAQIYHLPPSFPQGMLIWAVGVLPMAFVFKSRIGYFLSIGLFLAWTLGQSMGFQMPQPIFLAVLLGLLLPMAYYLDSQFGLFLCLAIASLWLYLNLYLWADLRISAYLLVPLSLYGLLLLALSLLHAEFIPARWRAFRTVYSGLGVFVLGVLVTIQPFYGLWAMDKTLLSPWTLPWSYWIACSLLLLGSLLAAFVFKPGRPKLSVGPQVPPTQMPMHLAGPSYFTREASPPDPPASYFIGSPDAVGRALRLFYPVLLLLSFFWLLLPAIKFSVLPSLLGPLLAAGCYWFIRRSLSLLHAFFLLSLLWLAGLCLYWEFPWWLLPLFMLWGAGAYFYGWLLRRQKDRDSGLFFNAVGLLVSLGPLLFLTFHSFNQWRFPQLALCPHGRDVWILVGLGYAGLVLAGVKLAPYQHPRFPGGMLAEESGLALWLGLAPVLLGAVVCTLAISNDFTFAANAVLFLISVLLLIAGYRRREAYLKTLGFFLFSLLAVCRFLEMEWSLLYKSLLLVTVGVIVMLVGIIFEKNKDKVAVID